MMNKLIFGRCSGDSVIRRSDPRAKLVAALFHRSHLYRQYLAELSFCGIVHFRLCLAV